MLPPVGWSGCVVREHRHELVGLQRLVSTELMVENGQIGIGSICAAVAAGEDAVAQYCFTGSEIDNQERDTRACRNVTKHIPLPSLKEGRIDDNPMAGFDNDACQAEQPAVSRLRRFRTVQTLCDAGAGTVL